MLTIEDCLEVLNDIVDDPVQDHQGLLLEITNPWDRRFISDVAGHVLNQQSISTAQSQIVIKLIDRYEPHLVAKGVDQSAIRFLISSPVFRQSPYQSTAMPREVRWAGDSKLVFRFKYNASIVEDIKRLKNNEGLSQHTYPLFNREFKVWIVEVTSVNLDKIMDIIKRHNFGFDDVVAEFLMNSVNARGQKSQAFLIDETIEITVRDDDFFNSWINSIILLEK